MPCVLSFFQYQAKLSGIEDYDGLYLMSVKVQQLNELTVAV